MARLSRARRKPVGEEILVNTVPNNETVAEDDLCPICRLLCYRPVTTDCRHTLCESCMTIWADVSIANSMQVMDIDEEPVSAGSITGLEARCPMCRTQTTASLNEAFERTLRTTYPETYQERELEERAASTTGNDSEVQNLTLYIGNRHRLIKPADGVTNKHEWTFFVRPTRTDIIEEVQVHLHPTFRPPRVICSRQPYEVRRLGWGVFSIDASIILKAGYSWMSENAEDSPDGAEKGMLRLDWMLDFTGFEGKGSMGCLTFKVRNQRAWEDVIEERKEDERAWSRIVRQYASDGNYVPPDNG